MHITGTLDIFRSDLIDKVGEPAEKKKKKKFRNNHFPLTGTGILSIIQLRQNFVTPIYSTPSTIPRLSYDASYPPGCRRARCEPQRQFD